MGYRWLLFDADGTLFDYDLAEAKALQWTFEQQGIVFESVYAKTYRQVNALIWERFERGEITSEALRVERFELLFQAHAIHTDTALFSQQYLKNLAKGSDLIRGAEDLVRTLRKDYHLAVITNGLSDVQRPRLSASGILDVFEGVFISEEIGVAKPDTGYFDVVFAGIGQPEKNEVLIIGDSLSSDMRGGFLYGVDTCWFNPKEKKSNGDLGIRYEIRELSELLDVLAAS